MVNQLDVETENNYTHTESTTYVGHLLDMWLSKPEASRIDVGTTSIPSIPIKLAQEAL